MSIELIGTIKPKNAAPFPMVEDIDLKGGFRLVADAAELAAIPAERRQEGMLVYQVDTKQYWRLEADLVTWVEMLLGGGGTTYLVWDSAKTWAQIYSEINAAGGVCTLLVVNDSTKEMTPDPLGSTNVSGVQFVGIKDQDGNCPTIDIDSLGVGGFLFDDPATLRSKDILWQTYYQVVAGPGHNCYWEFDGGGLTSNTIEAAYRSITATVVLRNGAILDGSLCTTGLFMIRGGGLVITTGGSTIGPKSFYANVGVPPWPTLTMVVDSGTTIDANAVAGTGMNVARSLYDKAELVSYDDSMSPVWTCDTVQQFLDMVKDALAPPGHAKIDFWAGGETWDQVYARTSVANTTLLYVWWDGATPREVTPNPMGTTSMGTIRFVGLRQANGLLPTVRIDSANVGTFIMSGAGDFHSKDINWVMPNYQLVDGSINIETEIELDGGSITTVAACAGVWKVQTARLKLLSGATFDGSNCNVGAALIEATGVGPENSRVYIELRSTLGANSIISTVAHPLTVNLSVSGTVDPSAIGGTVVVTSVLSALASRILYDNTDSHLASTTVQAAIDELQATKRSTGLLSGGGLAVNGVDNTKFDIAAGTGVVVNNYADPINPTMTWVSWPDTSGVLDLHIADEDETYVCIDSAGAVVQLTASPTEIQRRDYILIGWTSHIDHATLDSAFVEPYFATDVFSQLQDFLENFGAFNIDGNVYDANGANLKINRSAGKTFDNGANYAVTNKNPNVITSSPETPVVDLYYFWRDPAEPDDGWHDDEPPVTDIDPEHYDDGTGTLADVTAGKWTIQLITFYAPTGATDIQYGQVEYDTLEDALAHVQDPVELDPYNSYDTLRGWLIVKQGATDLSDALQAKFISAGKFGGISSATGGGGTGEANTASNQGLAGSGLYLSKAGVDLQFANIAPGSTKISVTPNAPQKTVDIDVVQANLTIGMGQVSGLSGALSGKVDTTRTLTAGSGLSGGGDLSANRSFACDFGTGIGQVCQGNDGRLSDARTPLSHKASHEPGGGDAMTVDAAAGTGSLRTLGTSATSACAGDDGRLSDARTPTSHAASHNAGGGDALAIDAAAGTGSLRTLGTSATSACAGNDGRLSDARTPTSHASSHQNGGSDEVATATAAANAIPKAGGTGKLAIGWIPTGSTSTTVCIGDDSRLSDARTPTAHASTHVTGGSDVIANAVAGGAAGLMSGADKTKLDGLDAIVADSNDVVPRPVVAPSGGTTRALATTYVGSTFDIPRKCSFVNAYLRLTNGTIGAIVRVTIYQQTDGNSGTAALVATGSYTLIAGGAQIITIPIVGSLKRGLAHILVGIDTATAATARVYSNIAIDLLNQNMPAGKAPATFTTAITVNGTPPATFAPATQGTPTTLDVAAVIRIGA